MDKNQLKTAVLLASLAGFMDAENQRSLATEEGIHVCQGQIWSQHGIDNGDGDGGICYPYYPSREHYLKPAQGPSDFIDCVCLDGWTCDFLPARRQGFEGGFNSRLGVARRLPEPLRDLLEALPRWSLPMDVIHLQTRCKKRGRFQHRG